MKFFLCALALSICLAGPAAAGDAKAASGTTAWNVNATIIEACSCPMFCQCYFNTKPAGRGGHEGHGAEHFCKFNNAFKVNKGMYGSTKLDGAKFWVSGDLGDDFSDAEMEWAVITFDKSTTKEQRDAIGAILNYLYPVKWKSVTTAEGEISWTATKDGAHALLDGGRSGEVNLKRFQGMTNDPIVIKNLKYWGAPRNDGFVLMPASAHGYRIGDKPFDFKDTNGFMITFDIDSKSAPPAPGGSSARSY